MTPVHNVFLEHDEGTWMICLEDDLGSHYFVCDPALVEASLRPWRLYMEEGEEARREYEASKREVVSEADYMEAMGRCHPEWVEAMAAAGDLRRKAEKENGGV